MTMKVYPFTRQKFVDSDGYLTPSAQNYFDLLIQNLNDNFNDQGATMPSLTTDQINYISNNNTHNSKSDGTIYYDSQSHSFKGKVNGTVKTFTLT